MFLYLSRGGDSQRISVMRPCRDRLSCSRNAWGSLSGIAERLCCPSTLPPSCIFIMCGWFSWLSW